MTGGVAELQVGSSSLNWLDGRKILKSSTNSDASIKGTPTDLEKRLLIRLPPRGENNGDDSRRMSLTGACASQAEQVGGTLDEESSRPVESS